MFWSLALHSKNSFPTSLAATYILPASLRKSGEFVLIPHLSLASQKASQKTATQRTKRSLVKQHRTSCRFVCRQLKRDSICEWGKILYTSLHSGPGPCLPLSSICRANKILVYNGELGMILLFSVRIRWPWIVAHLTGWVSAGILLHSFPAKQLHDYMEALALQRHHWFYLHGS